MTILNTLREKYHRSVKSEILRKIGDGVTQHYNIADVSSKSSKLISKYLIEQLPGTLGISEVSGQTAGDLFENLTCLFIQDSFSLLGHIRPGNWNFSTISTNISNFEQYYHLKKLDEIINNDKELKSAIGTDYLVTPDIIVSRKTLNNDEINIGEESIVDNQVARDSSLRNKGNDIATDILHASISCKWTIRSDRSQNTRTEALNLIRNRKGNLPHIVCVTAEPLPMRISAIAMGTGDLDCVYHFALYELVESVKKAENEDQLETLETLIQGRRLRDISDLPLDLAV